MQPPAPPVALWQCDAVAQHEKSIQSTTGLYISHMGPSVHSRHYVAHIRRGEEWVLFNDDKVVKADAESVSVLKKMTYLYFFFRE
jgi:ubiquitin carboxyl-terminal hydrolase 5/13